MTPHTSRAQGLSMVHSATTMATCSPREPCTADVLKVVFPVSVVVVVVGVVVGAAPAAAVVAAVAAVVAAGVAAGVAHTVVHFVVQAFDSSECDIAKTTQPHITC